MFSTKAKKIDKIFTVDLTICKALSKQEGQKFRWDADLWILFLNFNQLSAAKKDFKKQASLQMLGPSYFVRVEISSIFVAFLDNINFKVMRIIIITFCYSLIQKILIK